MLVFQGKDSRLWLNCTVPTLVAHAGACGGCDLLPRSSRLTQKHFLSIFIQQIFLRLAGVCSDESRSFPGGVTAEQDCRAWPGVSWRTREGLEGAASPRGQAQKESRRRWLRTGSWGPGACWRGRRGGTGAEGEHARGDMGRPRVLMGGEEQRPGIEPSWGSGRPLGRASRVCTCRPAGGPCCCCRGRTGRVRVRRSCALGVAREAPSRGGIARVLPPDPAPPWSWDFARLPGASAAPTREDTHLRPLC